MKTPSFAATGQELSRDYPRYVEALLAGDRRVCHDIMKSLVDSDLDLRSIYDGFIRRSLYEVGDLWMGGWVSVATEHLATAITESLLGLVYPRLFSQRRNGRIAVVSCGPREAHRIGAKMVADMFELNGWRGYYLGADVPASDLVNLIGEKQPEVVTLSIAMSANLEPLLQTAEAVRQRFPTLPILVGGQGFQPSGRERAERISGVRFLGSLDELESWMQSPPSPEIHVA
jgi:methanogenic corrinoid protein MtbC1